MTAHHSHETHPLHGGHNGYIALIIIVVLAVILGLVYVKSLHRIARPADVPISSGTVPTTVESQTSVDPATTIIASAKDTSSIEIKSCVPDPAVARFILGSSIRFTNHDDRPHIVSFDPSHTFVVPAQGQITQDFDFWKFPGIRSYTCDQTKHAGDVYAYEK